MFLLPVSKICHLSCCESMNIELMDLCSNPDRHFLMGIPMLWSSQLCQCFELVWTCGCVFASAAAHADVALQKPVLACALPLPPRSIRKKLSHEEACEHSVWSCDKLQMHSKLNL